MGSHPINLTVRFLLELSALVAMGIWGWKQGDGFLQYILMIGIPVLAATIWGTFAVGDDPSRSGKAPVPVPGILRLIIELVFFGFAIWALHDTNFSNLSLIMGILVVIHYIVSYDRITWLINR